MKQCVAISVTFVLWSGAAAAQTFCADMRNVTAQGAILQMALPETKDTTTCTRSLMLSGGAQLHCGWAFPYRAAAATKAFERLLTTVQSCLGNDTSVTADLDVNHPDFYDLQTFQLGDQEVGVSLKDKGALSATYVFLRITLPE